MTAETTPEMLALARKSAAKYWQTGNPGDEDAARSILSGDWDDLAYTQAALAAIREMDERVERVLDKCNDPCPQCRDALRNGEHYHG